MPTASSSKRYRAGVVVIALILGSAGFQQAVAQVAGGTISGTVSDPSGRVIPDVQIVIKNLATGVTRTTTTNPDGLYNAPNLVPGTYEVTFISKGFKSQALTDINLTVGATQVLDMTLKVGSTAETIDVQTEVPAVQVATSDISAVVGATTVRELPLNGRSWTDLAQLQPGVDAVHTQLDFSAGTDRGNRGFGQQLTISGARPQQNNYRLDGVSLNDYANGAPGSVLGGNLGVDAIQEFSVLTSNYSAEYGKTSGGVVNAITRSGTNQIHGSAYEFLRNSKFDAKNYFDDANSPIPPFKRNQFGGTLGGPIIKDHTFFFADYEAIRQDKGITEFDTVPSQAARNGNLATGQVTVDPAAAAFLPFWHLPNQGIIASSNGDLGTYSFAGQQVVNENFVTSRVDHKLGDKDSLFGTYMLDRTTYSSPDGLNNVEFNTLTSRQFLALEETHLFSSTFANTIRVGGNHERVDNNKSFKAINPLAARTDLGVGGTAFPGRAAPQVIIGGGVTPFTGGIGGSPTYLYHWNSIQAYDDAFWSHGTHSIRFGGVVERMLLNVVADTDPNGIWNFSDLASFLQNQPSKFQGGIASTLSPRNLRQTLVGAYLQDDWRARSNLTLNLGLRYEMTTVIKETSGKVQNLPNISSGTLITGNPFFVNPTLKNFEPRIGFAWDVFHNGRTAVRGGIGLFDVLPLPYQFPLMVTQAIPFFSYTVDKSPGNGSFYNFGGQNIIFPSNQLRVSFIPHPKRNYVGQWNLNIQQQITSSLTGMVAYVGSRGIHQPFRIDDANLSVPTRTSAGYVFPKVDIYGNAFSSLCNSIDPNVPDDPSCSPAPTVNPNYGSVRMMLYEGQSYYNALEAQLAKRMSHGFQIQGTFTWSKSIDTSSASVAGDSFGNSISSLPWYDIRLDRGLSDFNVGRTLVVNGVWDVPTPKSLSGAAQWALGGWELGTIFTASDGVPFTPTWGTGSDPSNTNNGDDWAFPTRLMGGGCRNATNPGNVGNYIKTQCFQVPTAPTQAFFDKYCDPAPPNLGAPLAQGDLRCFNLRGNSGRNSLISPGVASLDFSVFKNNYIPRISEKFNIQFRAEMFNVINHPNFGPPTVPDNTDIFDGTGAPTGVAGRLSKTTTTAREIQFAVKVIF